MPYLKNITQNIQTRLKNKSIQTYEIDSKVILKKALNFKSQSELWINSDYQLTQNELNIIEDMVQRREAFEPIAYIINSKSFWEFEFFVNQEVLIPRPESELFIEEILSICQNTDSVLKILDIGVGSGALIITLLKIFNKAIGIGVDINKGALSVAAFNAKNLNVENRLNLIQSDCFSAITNNQKFDIIISNPPYISIQEWAELDASVKNYEPKESLTDFDSGFLFYKKILSEAHLYLNPNGYILFEIGYNQSNIFQNIIKNYKNFELIRIKKDIASIERLVVLKKIL